MITALNQPKKETVAIFFKASLPMCIISLNVFTNFNISTVEFTFFLSVGLYNLLCKLKTNTIFKVRIKRTLFDYDS